MNLTLSNSTKRLEKSLLFESFCRVRHAGSVVHDVTGAFSFVAMFPNSFCVFFLRGGGNRPGGERGSTGGGVGRSAQARSFASCVTCAVFSLLNHPFLLPAPFLTSWVKSSLRAEVPGASFDSFTTCGGRMEGALSLEGGVMPRHAWSITRSRAPTAAAQD